MLHHYESLVPPSVGFTCFNVLASSAALAAAAGALFYGHNWVAVGAVGLAALKASIAVASAEYWFDHVCKAECGVDTCGKCYPLERGKLDHQ